LCYPVVLDSRVLHLLHSSQLHGFLCGLVLDSPQTLW
ncbi:hypothetical protein NPIL_698161, partial [Nephila pilipes]